MAEQQVTVRNIAWSELFPWLILFRAVRIALMARVLVLGAIGLIVTSIGWSMIGGLYSGTDDLVVKAWRTSNGWLWSTEPSGLSIKTNASSAKEVLTSAASNLHLAPVEAWLFLTRPFQNLFDADLTPSGFICMCLACVWELLVWGIVGGAIARIAALKFTRDEALAPLSAIRHAVSKLPSYSLAPVWAMVGAAVFGLQLLVLGAVMNLSFFAMLAGFVWPFVLILGLLMAILLIGALVGWPLMWATVSVEGTDAFDALSRSYAYVYQRPWRLLWYVIVAAILAAVSMFVVKGFATSAIALGDWSVSWGLHRDVRNKVLNYADERKTIADLAPVVPALGATNTATVPATTNVDSPISDNPNEVSGMLGVARRAIGFWKSLWKAVAAGFQVGYVWVAGVGVYLLLRRDIDGAEMDEVYIGPETEYGMPGLESDAISGVPAVAASKPAQAGDTGG